MKIWDAATGNTLLTYNGNSPVAWSPNGNLIVSGNDVGGLAVWYAVDRKLAYTYRDITSVQAGYVNAVAWSSDGARIASAHGSYDQTGNDVQVWDAATGNTLITYHGQLGGVDTVAWSPHGKLIASGGYGGDGDRDTVKVWQGE